jgi:hypothetical protein
MFPSISKQLQVILHIFVVELDSGYFGRILLKTHATYVGISFVFWPSMVLFFYNTTF